MSLRVVAFACLLGVVAVCAEECFLANSLSSGHQVTLCVQEDGSTRIQKMEQPRRQLQEESAETSADKETAYATQSAFEGLETDLNNTWVIIAGAMVFLMQAGFSLVEAGSVGTKNVQNILFKNIMDACVGCLGFWFIGYGLAYGGANDNAFVGVENFGLSEANDGSHWVGFFFNFVFAATAATIVSGAVAERVKLEAYFVYSLILTIWIYPPVVHWVWDDNGWLSAFNSERLFMDAAAETTSEDGTVIGGVNGMIDFAGSGVVHMVGGFSALVAAWIIGPRRGRFNEDGSPAEMRGHSMTLQTLGVVILWFGWYGFNPGSTLAASGGASFIAGRVAVTTSIAAAAAGVTCTVWSFARDRKFELPLTLNGILGGLVAITAPCSVVDPWAALVIGVIGGLVYLAGRSLLLKLRIDDPVEASVVHGFCGFWGVLAAGIFCNNAYIEEAYGYKNDAFDTGTQFLTQLIGAVVIAIWSMGNALVLFYFIKVTIGLRVSELQEVLGLDRMEHGGGAYNNARNSTEDGVEMVLNQAMKLFKNSGTDGTQRASTITTKEYKSLRDVFMLFDKSGTGSITHKDFKSVVKSLNLGLADKEVDQILAGADDDNSGTIEFDEFIFMITGCRQNRSRAPSAAGAMPATNEVAVKVTL